MPSSSSIVEVEGDLLDADVAAWVNPVNCRGVLGAGLARQFADRYPGIFSEYRRLCRLRQLDVGQVVACPTGAGGFVVCLPTKRDFRFRSELAWVRAGLRALRVELGELGLTSVAVPALGCGLGGLPWTPVRTAIFEELGCVDGLRVLVFPPRATR